MIRVHLWRDPYSQGVGVMGRGRALWLATVMMLGAALFHPVVAGGTYQRHYFSNGGFSPPKLP
jgi:hypothetical protein